MTEGLKRIFGSIIVAVVLILFDANGFARAEQLSSHDARVAKAALEAIDKRKWAKARRFTSLINNPLARKLARWAAYIKGGGDATFQEIAGFIANNPNWPKQFLLRRRAEGLMAGDTPHSMVIDWFRTYPPLSAIGKERLGAALLAIGERNQGKAVLRDAWINGNFTKGQEKRYYKRYRSLLTLEDHVIRLDRLLWDGRKWPARRMMWKVDPGFRALSEARYSLRYKQGNVDKAIAKVPDNLKDDPGLAFDRIRWRRQKGRDEAARELFLTLPDNLFHLDKWWKERNYMARLALRKGHVSESYRIVKNHGLKEGRNFAQAEWMAGWIALRFLNEYKVALDHFTTMFNSVKYPASRSRGAYWAGRAAKAMNDPKAAKKWFRIAAGNPTNYHGQLALARLNPGRGMVPRGDPIIKISDVNAFNNHELARTARILYALDNQELMKSFVLSLSNVDDSPKWRFMTASLARAHDRPDLAIYVSKLSMNYSTQGIRR